MRVKVDYKSSDRKVYNKFCLQYPDLKISFEVWKEIIYTFNYLFRDYILESGDKVKIPWGFGALAISKKKPKKYVEINGVKYIHLPVNWKKSRGTGTKIYHLNAHTDGYKFKWYWFIQDARFYMSDIWVFKPSRVSSRRLTEYLNRSNSRYAEIYKQWSI